jgi:CMP-N,N'-diacetyllegionaminic acid synthase
MRILGVTLARGGSRGVPHKHIRMLGDKPVLVWTIQEALKCTSLTSYHVSSDDDEILEMAVEHGAFIIPRPAELALDTTPTLPALQHAVRFVEQVDGEFDYIVEIRATSPFKTAEDIEKCITILKSSGADSVIGVTRLEDHHPARAKWLDENFGIHDFIPEPADGRRQALTPKAYIRNGTIYAFKRDAVMGQEAKLFGHKHSVGYVMPAAKSINIDTPLDFLLCEALVRGDYEGLTS